MHCRQQVRDLRLRQENELLRAKRTDDAVRIFEWNAELYPGSWNVYDSLGEALMTRGDRASAILNYLKSLELNPDNSGAALKLKEPRREEATR